jgi:hypothetical protein
MALSGPEHYKQAEKLLNDIRYENETERSKKLQEAQVHATPRARRRRPPRWAGRRKATPAVEVVRRRDQALALLEDVATIFSFLLPQFERTV